MALASDPIEGGVVCGDELTHVERREDAAYDDPPDISPTWGTGMGVLVDYRVPRVTTVTGLPTALTAVDLFSGLGGTSLGLRQAGFNVAAAVELNPLAVESYKLNLPAVHLWTRDIRRLAAREVLEGAAIVPGETAVLAACPPCQGFSTLRTLNGSRRIDDPRNGLLRHVTRFVRVLKPMTVMAENVPGLMTDASFETFIEDLEKLRYKVRHEVVDTADYGVPQRRLRLLIVASRLGNPPFGERSQPPKTVRRRLCQPASRRE